MTASAKTRLMIFNDCFYPAYKAGGPVQSLSNLVVALQHEYDIYVVTGSKDLNDDKPVAEKTDQWIQVLLPGADLPVHVWYAEKVDMSTSVIRSIIKQIIPEVVYLNGVFSYRYFLLPIITLRKIKIVVCPRGMLQRGALSGKWLKKKIYLGLLKLSGWMKNIHWHATNEEEAEDIKRIFGKNAVVTIASNVPRKPLEKITDPTKQEGNLRIVYLSLIAAKKNLLPLIHIIAAEKNISLDIYGPIKDASYWDECRNAIASAKGKVNYMGDVKPAEVQAVFSRYDASILLTKGENFGHAIYESLSSGRPVITSYFTPWTQLTDKCAGWNVDITSESEIISCLNHICYMKNDVFKKYCYGAYELAREYYSGTLDISSYSRMLSAKK